MLRVLSVLLCVQAVFSLWPIFVKYAIDNGTGPLMIAFMRDMCASLLLWVGVWIESGRPNLFSVLTYVCTTPVKMWHLEPYERSLFIFLGVCSSLNSVGYVIALQYVTPFNSALLHPTIPVFAATLSALWGVERLTPRKVLGTCICIAGSIVVVVSQADLQVASSLVGNLLLVLQSFAMACLLVGQKFVPARHSSLKTTAIYYMLGALISAPVSLTAMSASDGFSVLGPLAWCVVGFGAVFVVSFNYAAITWANKMSSPSVPASSMMLQPPLTFLLGSLFGERPQAGGWEIGGGIVIVAGLVLTTMPSREGYEDDDKGPSLGLQDDYDSILQAGDDKGGMDIDFIDIGPGAGSAVDGSFFVPLGQGKGAAMAYGSNFGAIPGPMRTRRSPSPVVAEDAAFLLKGAGPQPQYL